MTHEDEEKIPKIDEPQVRLKRKETRELKMGDMAITALGLGQERLYKIVLLEPIAGERFDPKHEKDSGTKRSFGPTYWDKKAEKSSIGHWNSHCEVLTDIIEKEDILMTFSSLHKTKIPL